MKRTLSIVLSVIILLSMCMPVFAVTSDAESGYADAYTSVLKKYKNNIEEYFYYAYGSDDPERYEDGVVVITDIVGNSIPELLFLYQQDGNLGISDLMIWTYDNGVAKQILHIESFDVNVAAGTRYCVYKSADGSLMIHDSIGDEGWCDYYHKYSYEAGQLVEKEKLTVEAGHYYNSEQDSTYTTGKYIFKGELLKNGKNENVSYEKCAELIQSYSANAQQIIVSNYWSDKTMFYESMHRCNKSFGSSCWGGNEPIVSKKYNYTEAITYLNTDWSGTYKKFVVDGGYLKNGQSFGTDGEPIVKLFDMDADGIPELIMSNGESARALRCAYIYTCVNDKVKYLGIGPTDSFYVVNRRFSGLWGSYNTSPDINLSYYRKNSTKVESELVCTIIREVDTERIEQITEDVALFNEAQREMQTIYGATLSEIKEMGWESFVEKCLSNMSTNTNTANMLTVPYDYKYDIDINWGWNLFNKNASEYDHNIALAGLLFSRATYDGSNTVESRMKDLGFDVFYSGMYTDGFFDTAVMHQPARTIGAQKININGEEKIIIVVAVRGTTNFVEWITDASACVTGFLDSAANTKESIDKTLPRIETKYGCKLTKDNTLFFLTGHSLGGAVSGILSYELLQYAERESIFTYTYASPNYATEDNCESYKNVHNIINTGDQVPNVPWFKKRYGNDWYYDLHLCQDELDELYSDGNVWWEEHFNNIRYCHDMKTYFACLLYGLPKNMGDGTESIYNLSSIHCPVDITIYDENGIEMGHTSGSDVIISEDSEVLIYLDGDSKYVMSPKDKKITIEITATDNGTMTFVPSKIETVSRSTIDTKTFENVTLTKGKTMVAEIGGDAEPDDIRLFVQDENGKNIAEILSDGSEKGIVNANWVCFLIFGVVVIGGSVIAILFFARKRKGSNYDKQLPQVESNDQEIELNADVQTEIVEETFCSKCGTPFAEGGLFCAKCGNARKSTDFANQARRN